MDRARDRNEGCSGLKNKNKSGRKSKTMHKNTIPEELELCFVRIQKAKGCTYNKKGKGCDSIKQETKKKKNKASCLLKALTVT